MMTSPNDGSGAEIRYFGCTISGNEYSKIIISGHEAEHENVEEMRAIARRTALIADSMVSGIVAGHPVRFPNVYRPGTYIHDARIDLTGNVLRISGPSFSIMVSEMQDSECGNFIEDCIRIGFSGDPLAISRWLSAVEEEYFPPAGVFPIIFWVDPPTETWSKFSVNDRDSMDACERTAFESCFCRWGYRTRQAGDNSRRTYYFEDKRDGMYVRLSV
jgi:hypothetical protein